HVVVAEHRIPAGLEIPDGERVLVSAALGEVQGDHARVAGNAVQRGCRRALRTPIEEEPRHEERDLDRLVVEGALPRERELLPGLVEHSLAVASPCETEQIRREAQRYLVEAPPQGFLRIDDGGLL